MSRRRILLAAIAACAIALLVVVLLRTRIERRHGLPRFERGEEGVARQPLPPPDRWTAAFRGSDPRELHELLEEIERRHPDLYRDWSLAYLHARTLLEADERDDAAKKLEPFAAAGHPLRDLALYHLASASEGDAASGHRRALIFEHPRSQYREEAVDEEVAWLVDEGDLEGLTSFAARLQPSASTARRRELASRIVELQADDDPAAALPRALALLRGETSDDAADRAAVAIDRKEIHARLTPEQLAMLGETLQQHRHYDRAAAVLKLALAKRYSDDLQFALGRSYFGAENYETAQSVYVRGANVTRRTPARALFLWHAARAAQLDGNDVSAERLMTAAIAVKGTYPSTTAALTQRIRTRAKAGRLKEAAADLALLRRFAGNKRAYLEGALPLALARLARGDAAGCVTLLDSIPRSLTSAMDRAEIAYWKARAFERRDPGAAVRAYLTVLESDADSLYKTFAKQRLRAAALQPAVRQAAGLRDAQVRNAVAARRFDLARELQTARVHLTAPAETAPQLKKLAEIYAEVPEYARVLALEPAPLQTFPLPRKGAATFDLLMAMALYDDAVPGIQETWDIRPAREALTRSLALNLGGASRESIYAIEVMMRSVPDDFVHELLPPLVRQLLHPRYFAEFVEADARRHDADPALVLAIMREESRFNPRAKSQAAARGLLQFIITTARDVGASIGIVDLTTEDLYDPRIIIRLGAKYIGELSGQFGGNGYRVAASYNAGPKQTALWSRLQAAPGDDWFLASVNFSETKDYVRKVMNSWERYRASAQR